MCKVKSTEKSNLRKVTVFLILFLVNSFIGFAQEKWNDDKIYQSLPTKVVLSEQDVAETIKYFRRDNQQKAVDNFVKNMPLAVTNADLRENVRKKLPESIKDLRLEDKKVNDLILKIISPVLTLYRREKVYEVWVIKHSAPFIFSDSGVFLVISTGLIKRLVSDDELLGYIAHEVGHENYSQTSIYTKYILGLVMNDNGDRALARKYWESLSLIELKCDAFGALTLVKLGYNPLSSIEGIERVEVDFPQFVVGFHPGSAIRRRVVEAIVPTESLSKEITLSADLKKLKALISFNAISSGVKKEIPNSSPWQGKVSPFRTEWLD